MQSKQTEIAAKCPQPAAGSPQWIQYKDNCYAFAMELYNYSIYTAGDAKEVCKKLGAVFPSILLGSLNEYLKKFLSLLTANILSLDPSATLLTVKDAEENQFVSMHLKEYHYITGRAWLGIQSNAQSLKWLDGSEVKYTNWAKGNENVRGECSVILTTNGTWSKTDCKTGKTRVVCKAPQVANRMGGAIAVAVLFIVVLLAGLICFLYKKKRLHWSGFSSVRYERGMYEDETDSMFTRDDNNAFAIRHEKTNTCIKVKNREITAGDCRETKETLWAWVSEHRLFNLGSQKCLGLDTKSQNTLKIVDCDSDLLTLWWRCVDAAILTESEKKLTLKNGIVSVSIEASDIWRRSNSKDGCQNTWEHDADSGSCYQR
ncbi:Lymphocyte antigen 75 [Varanus komodoensis]|nr:Lymphocyte antigen 75 [Varanus komodoensis]